MSLISSSAEFDSRLRNQRQILPQKISSRSRTVILIVLRYFTVKEAAPGKQRRYDRLHPLSHSWAQLVRDLFFERWCSGSARLFEAQQVLVQSQVSRPLGKFSRKLWADCSRLWVNSFGKTGFKPSNSSSLEMFFFREHHLVQSSIGEWANR